jgi:hypothetical protein
METKRKYFGRIQVKSNSYGEIIKIGVGPKDFKLLEESKNDTGWLTIDVKPSKDGGYYAEIYEPGNSTQQYGNKQAQATNTVTDDLF